MRILHITERFGSAVVGGAQRSVELLVRSQQSAGHDVGVLCAADGANGATDGPAVLRDANSSLGFCSWQIPLGHSSVLLRRPRLNKALSLACFLYEGYLQQCDSGVLAAIREYRPHVINTHILTGISDTIWPLARSLDIPVVHTLRDFYLLCARSSMFKARASQCVRTCPECRIVTWRRRRGCGQIDGIVGISTRILDIHRAHGLMHGRPTAVIPNAVAPPAGPIALYRGAEPAANGGFVVGYLGRLVPTKGIEQLIRAFARAQIPQATLRIAGEGDAAYVAALKREAASLPVDFAGNADAYGFLSTCSILAVPSLWEEPFGRVVAEALLMAVPVICSHRGAFPEILARFPGGMLTDPEDERRFAGDLITMRQEVSLLRRWLIEHSGRIADHFSSDAIGRQYVSFYEQILEAWAVTRGSRCQEVAARE